MSGKIQHPLNCVPLGKISLQARIIFKEEVSSLIDKRQLLLLLLFHFLLLSLDPLLPLNHLVREEREGGPGFHLSKGS